jgi:hypothetical protein
MIYGWSTRSGRILTLTLLLDLIPNLAAAAIGAVAVRTYITLHRQIRYRHLDALLPANKVIQIVMPTIVVPSFEIREGDGTRRLVDSHSNVLWVPLGDSLAVGRFLTRAAPLLRRKYQILQVTDQSYDPEQRLSIAFGGQYVNDLSNSAIRRHLPDFVTPDVDEVRIGSTALRPTIDRTGRLQNDYGFILSTSDDQGRRVVVIWGIHSPGTEIAVRALFEIRPNSRAGKLLKSGENAFIVTQGRVNGLRVSDIRVTHAIRAIEPASPSS